MVEAELPLWQVKMDLRYIVTKALENNIKDLNPDKWNKIVGEIVPKIYKKLKVDVNNHIIQFLENLISDLKQEIKGIEG